MLISRFTCLPLVAAVVLATACSSEPTAPTPGPRTQSIEVYSGPLDPGGTNTYLFTLQEQTTVRLMLAGAVLLNPLRTVSPALTLRIGEWDGSVCTTLHEAQTMPRLTSALHAYLEPGTYCAVVSDPGNLTEPIGATMRIVAPVLLRTGGGPGTIAFTSVVTPAGITSRTFESSVAGQVTITLDTVAAGAVEMALGIGVVAPDGSGCRYSQIVSAVPGGPGLSVPTDAGDYCVAIIDRGNISAPSSFTLTVVHP